MNPLTVNLGFRNVYIYGLGAADFQRLDSFRVFGQLSADAPRMAG